MKSSKRVLVVGSGLAAYGACIALLEKDNLSIDVIDIGLKEAYLGQSNKEVANASDINSSFYPYGINDNRWNVRIKSKRLCSSHAFGGFSKVWSGSVLKPRNEDLYDWPQESIPSDEEYSTIINSLNIAQIKDELNKVYPILPSGENYKNTKNVYLGRARTAYSLRYSEGGIKDAIPFDSSEYFNKLINEGLISYYAGQYVSHIEKVEDKLLVVIQNGSSFIKKTYDLIYLGAGCINTTGIVDKSIYGKGERTYTLKTVPYLTQILLKLPLFGSEKAQSLLPCKDRYGLCKYFIEQKNSYSANLWSHTQVGPLNRLIAKKIYSIIGFKLPFLVEAMKSIFYFSITTFHSSQAKESRVVSSIVEAGGRYEQIIAIEESECNCNSYKYLGSKLAILSQFRKLHLLPLPFSKIIDRKIKSNKLGNWHFGCTLPMKKTGEKLTDCLPSGESRGLPGVFIIDSSSFPSIPGTTVGLLTMANSYKIAKNSIH